MMFSTEDTLSLNENLVVYFTPPSLKNPYLIDYMIVLRLNRMSEGFIVVL